MEKIKLEHLAAIFSKAIKKEAPKFFKGMTLKTKEIDRGHVLIQYTFYNLTLTMSWANAVHEGGWVIIAGAMYDLKGHLLLDTDNYDIKGTNINLEIQTSSG